MLSTRRTAVLRRSARADVSRKLAPIEVGGVRTSELGTLYQPIVGGDYFYDYDRNTGAVTLQRTYASGKITEKMFFGT